MSKVIIGVGIPGSGKTTTLKKLSEEYSYEYICPDDIREELSGGNAMDHSRNSEVWDIANNRLKEALKSGKNVVFDATSARVNDRRNLIKLARESGAEKVQGVFAAVPFGIAQERNIARGMEGGRVVPKEAMDRMYDLLKRHPPTIEDGFDSVIDINEFQELTRVEMLKENDKILIKEFKLGIN
jgi:predicted kinase